MSIKLNDGSHFRMLDSKNKDIHLSWSEFFTVWLYKFLPVFEYNNLFSEFKFISLLNKAKINN